MDSTLFNGLLFVSIGLTALGVSSRVRIYNLVSVPILFALAFDLGATNYLAAFGLVIFAIINIWFSFFTEV